MAVPDAGDAVTNPVISDTVTMPGNGNEVAVPDAGDTVTVPSTGDTVTYPGAGATDPVISSTKTDEEDENEDDGEDVDDGEDDITVAYRKLFRFDLDDDSDRETIDSVSRPAPEYPGGDSGPNIILYDPQSETEDLTSIILNLSSIALENSPNPIFLPKDTENHPTMIIDVAEGTVIYDKDRIDNPVNKPLPISVDSIVAIYNNNPFADDPIGNLIKEMENPTIVRTDSNATSELFKVTSNVNSTFNSDIDDETTSNRLLCTDTGKSCFQYNPFSGLKPSCWSGIDNNLLVNGYPLNRCCNRGGNFQSPINIRVPGKIEEMGRTLTYDSLSITGYLENNGVYPTFTVTGTKPVLQGAPTQNLKGYVLDSINFHFGKKGGLKQTEHLVDGRSFDAEAQLVHHHADYSNLQEASLHEDGILIMAVFLSTTEGNTDSAFDKILSQVSKVIPYTASGRENSCSLENNRVALLKLHGMVDTKCLPIRSNRISENCATFASRTACGNVVTDIHLNPGKLLPIIPRYLYYEGSLTVPPCSEAVIWLVAESPTKIDPIYLEYFSLMESRISGETISTHGNIRPLQKSGRRHIRRVVFN
ncbi:putative carbonic anhydrase 1 [Patella vulgata]|uniref:putative carbonic anhydrase 1 n=1 Tax=Patella vulgata TaxID=6465 RepID=UPI00217FCACB|nr:putative carbonic anhydrase 1 [Patella vulgata]